MNALNPWLAFALAALATWRVTHLLAEEDGPGGLVLQLRMRLGAGKLGALMDCFQCLSLWIAMPFAFALAHSVAGWILAWLALSGAACLFERIGAAHPPWPGEPLHFPENNHELLRSRTNGPES
ncbi:MAG: hypothetical protein JSS18_17765 [Proteobacteria bacterium]|uniref:hypothetical protein n=1 Tax=Ottowia sp. TaxID=1898956 RepID=UPI001D7685F9|nr:hypothetical protein [Ottowia sp.]MBS0404313.1 hypothetical protein [Pseudomonadota bacterium]MBS0415300.1 hypothetical protein [Pseudomonadota bacterium]